MNFGHNKSFTTFLILYVMRYLLYVLFLTWTLDVYPFLAIALEVTEINNKSILIRVYC